MSNQIISSDETEMARRERLGEINGHIGERASLEARYGQVWNAAELARDFIVQGFLAPFVVVTRVSDGRVGALEFQHNPRFYFNFVAD